VPLIALIGPGLLVAATGVGAGDLATAWSLPWERAFDGCFSLALGGLS